MPSTKRSAFLSVVLIVVWSISLYNNLDSCGVLGPGSWMADVPTDKSLQIEKRQSGSLSRSQEVEVGACILIMDGNHYLIEWLAYHYHAANLRHLIIHSDKNSATSPSQVLDRWRDRITIQEWNETDFLDASKYKDASSYEMHQLRQNIFYHECMKDLQRQGRDWALLTDPDEYLIIGEPNNAPSSSTPTVLEVLKSFQSFQIPFGLNITYNPCIAIRRRQFTLEESKDEIVQTLAPPGFDEKSFQTLRWRKAYFEDIQYTTKSGETCLVTEKFNRLPNKVIVDLHRLDPKEFSNLFARANVHRPLEICPNVYFEKTPFVLNHYSGTKEQWLSRSNDGRGKNHRIFAKRHFDGFNHVKRCLGLLLTANLAQIFTGSAFRIAKYEFFRSLKGKVEDDSIRPWLKDFAADVGTDEALRLLKDVGKAPPLPAEEINISIADNKYGIGDLVEVESKKEPGKWYKAEVFDSYPKDHYTIVFVHNCGVQHTSLDTMRPLRNKKLKYTKAGKQLGK